jgi:phenylpropionate dioxygenase-like ring-hydroxylating dioxygenase large terminal subunit
VASADGVRLADAERGVVSRRIFIDEDIYRREMERIFHRCWLWLGHDSMLPNPGDYVATYTGEDPIILWRDSGGRVRAFLNTCTHRGNKLCLVDRGHAAALTCSYHGWTFNSEGKLTGVPFFERAYYGRLDRQALGLVEMPKVVSYGGLIFGTWDAGAPSLDDYLGELRWWLEAFLTDDSFGGLETLPGAQKYQTAGNWKLIADNFAGDHYHTVAQSHLSVFKINLLRSRPTTEQTPHGYFMVACEPGHGLGGVWTNTAMLEGDLARAEQFGPEVKDYVQERWRRRAERMGDIPDKPTGIVFGNCFPNFDIQNIGSAFAGNLLSLTLPRGPRFSEIWQWLLIERQAPEVCKRAAATMLSRGQSGAGLIGVDDGENFERIAEAAYSPLNERLTFHYAMGIEQDGRWPGQEDWAVRGIPGTFGPEFWERGQRSFYRQWARCMERA